MGLGGSSVGGGTATVLTPPAVLLYAPTHYNDRSGAGPSVTTLVAAAAGASWLRAQAVTSWTLRCASSCGDSPAWTPRPERRAWQWRAPKRLTMHYEAGQVSFWARRGARLPASLSGRCGGCGARWRRRRKRSGGRRRSSASRCTRSVLRRLCLRRHRLDGPRATRWQWRQQPGRRRPGGGSDSVGSSSAEST